MNKKSILYILLDLVFLIVFNTLFFVLGGIDHPASVWISYVFIHLAYIMILLTPRLVRKGKNKAALKFPLQTVSTGYFFAAFIVGLFFVLIRSSSYKAALVIQIVISGVYAALLLTNMIANEHTAENQAKREDMITFVKTASSRVKLLLDKTDSKKANRKLETAYDTLYASPVANIESVKILEIEILNKILELEAAVKQNSADEVISLADELIDLTESRNAAVKSGN